MIHPDLYTKTSLIQQIEDLSHAKTAVTSVKVAHLVTSYFVAYLVGDDGTLTYSAEEIEDFYR